MKSSLPDLFHGLDQNQDQICIAQTKNQPVGKFVTFIIETQSTDDHDDNQHLDNHQKPPQNFRKTLDLQRKDHDQTVDRDNDADQGQSGSGQTLGDLQLRKKQSDICRKQPIRKALSASRTSVLFFR